MLVKEMLTAPVDRSQVLDGDKPSEMEVFQNRLPKTTGINRLRNPFRKIISRFVSFAVYPERK